MMDKFILRCESKLEGYKSVYVDVPTHEKLLQIKEESGVALTKILAQMVKFCLERLTISEE